MFAYGGLNGGKMLGNQGFNDIEKFVFSCVENYDDRVASIEDAYNHKVTGESVRGVGICIALESKSFSRKSKQTCLEFVLSDGNYSLKAIAHNEKPSNMVGGMTDKQLTQAMMVLTDSLQNGKQIIVSGSFVNHKNERVFLTEHIESYADFSESQMTESQRREFVALCKKHSTTPTDLMMRDDTLWAEYFASDALKRAIMLYCLSPQKKQDMIHIGVVSSVGEGKDHMLERVIAPLVPCGVASTGKLCTMAGLMGAMSGEDLNSISLGLIPKHNNERVAVSEFQTWEDEVFGELMNAMANGYITIQKGNVDTTRDARTNFLFLGNPPADYEEYDEQGNPKHDKMHMLQAFGKYTFQIVSRLSLIFTQMSLAGKDSKSHIRDAILKAMDNQFEDGTDLAIKIGKWRSFFREYLKSVSQLRPSLHVHQGLINSLWDSCFEENSEFRDIFIRKGTSTDYRKYQQFANLIRGMARLDGIEDFATESTAIMYIRRAVVMFGDSLKTLKENWNPAVMDLMQDPHYAMWWAGFSKYEEENEKAGVVKKAMGWNHKQLKELEERDYVILLGDTVMFQNKEYVHGNVVKVGDSSE